MNNLAAMSFLFWICVGLVSAQGGRAQQSDVPSFDDSGQPIELTIGQEFKIALDSNPTTGYLWRLSQPQDETIVTFVGDKYEIPTTPGRVAGGGKHIWTFRAVGQGHTVIVLEYCRPWEKGVAPIKKATFTVVVR